jgi:hypothetical protein
VRLWIELQRLVFDLQEKKSRLWPGLFLSFLRVFLRVVLEMCRFLAWFFVVRVWWIRGESWSIDDRSAVS